MKFKRVLSIALICFMCFSLSAVSFAEETEGSNIVTDIELLNMLGVFTGYEDGNLHPDWSITRMEFAAIIMRVLGYDTGIGQIATQFSDVPADSWGSGYVKMAYDLGIVSGYGDGTFRPDNKITESESIKMIVAALGYSYWAEKNGGYPAGYISMGARLDILDRAVDSVQEATREYVAAILVNALEARIVHPELENVEEYEDNILIRLGITVREGTLTSIYGANLAEGTELEKGEVMVSGEVFNTELDISADFIGTQVKIYIKDYDRADEMLVGIVGAKYDSSLIIDAEDIEEGTTLSNLVYSKDGRKKISEPLAADIKITYNGKLIENSADYTAERLKPENGSVRLIDNDRNNVYEAAVVRDYKTYVVRSVSEDIISDIYGGRIEFDEETIVTVTKDNAVCSLSDIAINDVLSAAVSLDGNVVDIIICRDTLEGIVQAYGDEDGERVYTLDDGEEYKTTSSYKKALAASYSSAEKIELGSSMLFYLDHFGRIAMGVLAADSKKDLHYGYIIDLAKNNGLSMSGTISFKILGEENKFLYLDTAGNNKVTFGRMEEGSYVVSKVSGDAIYDHLLVTGWFTKQMVKYELNSDGEIKELYLKDTQSGSEYFSCDAQRATREIDNHTIDGTYRWDNDTVLFYIPRNGENTAALSSGKCVEYFANEDSIVMELWDVETDGYVNCIMCTDTSTGRTITTGSTVYIDYVNSPVMLITDVKSVLSDDGIYYTVVEGWENKKPVRTLLSDTLSAKASGLKKGVVIQYTTNESDLQYAEYAEDDKTMVLYSVLFNCNDPYADTFMSYDYGNNPYNNARIQFGYSEVSRYDYPFIRFTEQNCLFEIHSGTAVYVYDCNSKTVKKGSMADINEGSKVFMRARYANLREIVVIKE